jgi:hypothetical protein
VSARQRTRITVRARQGKDHGEGKAKDKDHGEGKAKDKDHGEGKAKDKDHGEGKARTRITAPWWRTSLTREIIFIPSNTL